ncbi:MAG: four helix bundle protein [Firmicutes bacterium]|nr:four helix bundle protein [Bacillota bacterium]
MQLRNRRFKNDTNKLILWQKAHDLVLKIYKLSKDFPKEEQFGLTSQIRRAAVSIPSNIVEGKARGSNKEYKRFLLMARGSLEEVKYQILLARDLKYIDDNKYNEIIAITDEIGKMLNSLVKKLS